MPSIPRALLLSALCLAGCTDARGAQSISLPSLQPRTITPFDVAKAEALIRNRLPCLGCHQLGGEGGRIGPDLSAVGARRSPAYIHAMIADPQGTMPGTAMPKTLMPDGVRELVVSYLTTRGEAERTAADPPRAAVVVTRPSSPDGVALYARYCASCHGDQGKGDGPNARYLPVPPAVHADRARMSQRSDEVLFDMIAGGGYIMNRSNRMPAFGATLRPEEIRALVARIRLLCGCEGPSWSRDGRGSR